LNEDEPPDAAPDIDPPDPERRVIGFSLHQLEQLSAAGGWARFVGIVGIVVSALLLLGFLAAIRLRPSVIARMGGEEPASLFVPMLLYTVGSLVAAILVWGYGSNVAAHLRREAGALTRGFRQLRFFFLLWTIVSALMVAREFLGAWRRF
jgi:hypothetical protein